jgi:integrase
MDATEIDPKTILSPEKCREIQKGMENYQEDIDTRANALMASRFISVIWLAGLRPSEVAALQKKHLNFSEDGKTSFIKVEQASSTIKANFTDDNESYFINGVKARVRKAYPNVLMMQELIEILKPMTLELQEDDWLFIEYREKTRPVATGLIHEYFRKFVVDKYTPYDLRHTNASILIHSGLNIIEVANRLGHSIPVCQKVYLHLFAIAEELDTSKEEEFLSKTRSKSNLRAV